MTDTGKVLAGWIPALCEAVDLVERALGAVPGRAFAQSGADPRRWIARSHRGVLKLRRTASCQPA